MFRKTSGGYQVFAIAALALILLPFGYVGEVKADTIRLQLSRPQHIASGYDLARQLETLGFIQPHCWQYRAIMHQSLSVPEQQHPLAENINATPSLPTDKILLVLGLLILALVTVLIWLLVRLRRLSLALQSEITRHTYTEGELIRRNQELLQLASIDTLTGLTNRRVIMQQAQSEIRRASRYQKDLAVLMLDIDHFKEINDRFGHAAGDRILAKFSSLLQQSIRDTDLAGRYGGEEFFILLPEIDIKTAISSAERIRMIIAAHTFTLVDGAHISITCSIGIAAYLPDQDDLDKLLLRADQAMYQAKHQGRNRCCVLH